MVILHKNALYLFLAGMVSSAVASIPLLVTGVDDRQVIADSATFQVPISPGYTYGAWLDGCRIPVGVNVAVTNADYHEVSVARTNLSTGEIARRIVRFIVRSSERKNSEWGLPPWTPYPLVNSTAGELAGARLRILSPPDYPLNFEIPIVAWIENERGHTIRANALLQADGHSPIQLRRGAGSGYLAPSGLPGPLHYNARVPGIQTNKTINIETNTEWSFVGGMLTGTIIWPPNARMAITNHLTLPAGSSLTIGEGAIVRLDPGVNITNDGALVISGTEERPVVFTPISRGQPWGGFFMRNSSGSIVANSTIFIASGADPKAGGGHRSEQCLFFLDHRPRLILTNCAAIDLAGQFGHASSSVTNANDPVWTEVTIVHTLVQRCLTGGEWNGCKFKFLNSAVLEIPLATSQFADDDGDGLYFIQGETEVRDSVIGWAHDDGIDSGSGDGGSITVSNTWIESIFHDAFAWSGGGGTPGPRRATNDHCVVLNCGQGYECGWSSGGEVFSPFVSVQDSLAIHNGVGARFGDNYDWSYYGFLQITNSLLLNNRRDVWGCNWQADTNGWMYRSANMRVEGNYLSVANPYHPANFIWDPAAQAQRLVSFMTTPPDAPVGVALAVWTNQLDMASLFQGVPVCLSSFTTNVVSVDYALRDPGGILSRGTLSFAPGEMIKPIAPAGFDAAGKSWIEVALSNPVHGELTGLSTVIYQGSVPNPQISLAVNDAQIDLARIDEGVPVKLTGPTADLVSVSGQWEIPGRILANVSIGFLPGQSLQWIFPPAFESDHPGLLRLTLNQVTGAQLRGPSNLFFVKSSSNPAAPLPLVSSGANWNYYDKVTNEIFGWFTPVYVDAGWQAGPSPLGYGNSPQEATTLSFGSDPARKNITTYFRGTFQLTNASEIASISFNLRRDDGSVLYLNGGEVFRENMPDGTLSFSSTAITNVGGTATLYSSTTLPTQALSRPLRNGVNLVAVEIHQNNAGSSDLLFDLEVFGHLLPPSSIQPPLFWGLFSRTNLIIAWSDASYVLEQANDVAGPYSSVAQTSPWQVNPTHSQRYFRLSK